MVRLLRGVGRVLRIALAGVLILAGIYLMLVLWLLEGARDGVLHL